MSCESKHRSSRSGQNPRTLFKTWETEFGAARAKQVASTLPPRPLRGRWGAVTHSEKFLLRTTRSELVAVFVAAFAKIKPRVTKRKDGPHDVVDFDESAEDYSAKIGRWIRETLEAIKLDFFWASLVVANVSRGPLDHFHNWLQKALAPDQPPKMITLVVSKATSISEAFDDLLGISAYDTVWAVLWDVIEWRDELHWLAKIVEVFMCPTQVFAGGRLARVRGRHTTGCLIIRFWHGFGKLRCTPSSRALVLQIKKTFFN